MIYAKKDHILKKNLNKIDKYKEYRIILYLIYLNIVTGSIPRGQ